VDYSISLYENAKYCDKKTLRSEGFRFGYILLLEEYPHAQNYLGVALVELSLYAPYSNSATQLA